MTLLDTALTWVEKGFSVIPIGYYSKKPVIKSWYPYQTQLPTRQELLEWFPSELRNIALITGGGLVVIDFDVMDVFDYWYQQTRLDTYMVKTRRGVHVYIKTSQPAKNFHSSLLDVKAERGYVLIPPSIHPSGYQYTILQSAPILSINQLQDILPAEFTPEPEAVQFTDPVKAIDDPWELADRATTFDSNVIETIRGKISILSILDGERTSPDGRWYSSFCPFHDDHNPSFWIDLQRGMCGCRVCNIKEMDVINLYARIHQLNNRQAIIELQQKL